MDTSRAGLLDHILVGVGGSERSFVALRYAIDLAKVGQGDLDVIVVEEAAFNMAMALSHGDGLRRLFEGAEDLARRAADELEYDIRRVVNEEDVGTRITRRQGRVTECIVEAAQPVSIIVLGKRGCRAAHGDLLGSNTELIVRRTHKPVLLTPEVHWRPKVVLVAYAGKDLCPKVLATGATVAQNLRLPMHVITVAHDTGRCSAIQDQAREELAGWTGSLCFVQDKGHPAKAIVGHTTNETLLVMGAYGHSRLYHLTLGSVTEQVMRDAPGLVLLSAKETDGR
ncbi:MAG: universal stress protein [Phycisphaerae bacterium]|nr:universal stress protein [Phycisphaerae bacterium]